jgi:hypothetical protein
MSCSHRAPTLARSFWLCPAALLRSMFLNSRGMPLGAILANCDPGASLPTGACHRSYSCLTSLSFCLNDDDYEGDMPLGVMPKFVSNTVCVLQPPQPSRTLLNLCGMPLGANLAECEPRGISAHWRWLQDFAVIIAGLYFST